MKRIVAFGGFVAAFLWVGLALGNDFQLSSPQFKDGERLRMEQVYKGFGCEGANVSPVLEWSGAPAGTRSFALTVYDPDAPIGSGWWHWVVFNVPAGVTGLKRNAGDPLAGIAPEGVVQSRTDFGKPGYGGPCPPEGHGNHRYVFTVYALDAEKLPFEDTTPAAVVDFNLNAHAIGKTTLTGLYSR